MKYIQPIVIGLGLFVIGFVWGQYYETFNKTCDIFDVPATTTEAYCEISGSSPTIITEYVPRYIEKECEACQDCSLDFEYGLSEGFASCVWSYETKTSQKEPKRTELKARNWKR